MTAVTADDAEMHGFWEADMTTNTIKFSSNPYTLGIKFIRRVECTRNINC